MNNFDYYDFRIKNVIGKINEEIAFYEKCTYANVYPVNEYIQYLRKRIGKNEPINNAITNYNKYSGKNEIKKMNMDEYVKDIDLVTYSRPWNKLKEIHRAVKIKEFIDNLDYSPKLKPTKINKNKEYLKEQLCLGLKEKKFAKNKSEIIYDQEYTIILSISCLEYNKKTRLYEIDWDI